MKITSIYLRKSMSLLKTPSKVNNCVPVNASQNTSLESSQATLMVLKFILSARCKKESTILF